MPILHDWNLAITVDHILAGQGADPAAIRTRRPALVEAAEGVLAEGRALLSPVILYRRVPIEGVRHERLALNGGTLSGPAVARRLAAAQEAVVMIGTIGQEVEVRSATLFADDPATALALDGLGSAAATRLAIEACRFFDAQAAAEDMRATRPVSPGDEGWPVDTGQHELFALLDSAQIGVDLLPSGMMIPRKSFSMVIGLGPEVSREEEGSPCEHCDMRETCQYQHRYD
jgi:hypothetical protein